MILIAENQHEDQLLMSLTALLTDLGVEVDSLRQEDALAPVFWSANELDLQTDALSYMSKDDRIAFLLSIEAPLRASMRKAGLRTISSKLACAQGGHAHLNARMLKS